jgi:hypothetical protein
VKVTDRHTAIDYAHMLRDLSDVHFADAAKIVLVPFPCCPESSFFLFFVRGGRFFDPDPGRPFRADDPHDVGSFARDGGAPGP